MKNGRSMARGELSFNRPKIKEFRLAVFRGFERVKSRADDHEPAKYVWALVQSQRCPYVAFEPCLRR